MLLVPETNKGQQSWDWYAQVSSVLRLLVTATTARPNPRQGRWTTAGGRHVIVWRRRRRRRRRAQQDPNKVQREATTETAEDRAATRAALEGLDSAVEQAILHKAKMEAVREEVRSQPPSTELQLRSNGGAFQPQGLNLSVSARGGDAARSESGSLRVCSRGAKKARRRVGSFPCPSVVVEHSRFVHVTWGRAVNEGCAQERQTKKHLSFNQKEKRKRDAGQATSSKNFVEEEKRLLREAGGN